MNDRPDVMQAEGPAATLQSVEGIIQRLDYKTRKLNVIGEGRAWHFHLAPQAQVWFNHRRAPFRCLQPRDRVRVYCNPSPADLIEASCLFAEGLTINSGSHDENSVKCAKGTPDIAGQAKVAS